MAYIKKSALNEFQSIKKNIEQSWLFFKDNYKRYNEFSRFVFKTTMNYADMSVNNSLQKPNMEWNIVEAFLSRLCGEFSKMEPNFTVRTKDGVQTPNPDLVDLVEWHLKAAFGTDNLNTLSYFLYRNMLAGGYDVAKIYTDYADEFSFFQKIYITQVYDPTLTGFDPTAREPHKGDGRWCFELFPKSCDEIEELFGTDVIKDLDFTRSPTLESFNWSYKNQEEEIALLAEYYKKKSKKATIVQLSNGHTILESDYENLLKHWNESAIFQQAPIIVKSRKTDIITIDKYTICGECILDHVETNFSMLPLVFFDGNSKVLRSESNGTTEQVTRPYIYNARDNQKMKNFAGQSLCNEIENLVQHKWKAPVEGIPDNDDYAKAYIEPQNAMVVLYNQFKDGDPNQQLNPPQEIMRAPIPPELIQTFQLADNTMQVILGSYDASLGINNNELSGIAIMQGAMQSNAAAMPYTTGFIHGWARCAQMYLNLLPKYYATPRTIPIVKPDGTREYYEINKSPNVSFDYSVTALEVTVEPGVNYEVQKQIALKTLETLMSVSESFKAFMEQNGLEVLLDNIDIRGIDRLRAAVKEWQEQQQQAAANQPPPVDPGAVAMQQLQVQAQKNQMDYQVDQQSNQIELAKSQSQAAVNNKNADTKFLEVMSKIHSNVNNDDIERERLDAEQSRTAVEMSIELSKHMHEKKMDEMNNDSDNDGA